NGREPSAPSSIGWPPAMSFEPTSARRHSSTRDRRRSRYSDRLVSARDAIGCSGGYMRRCSTAAPRARRVTAERPATSAPGSGSATLLGSPAMVLSSVRRLGRARGGALADDLGAHGANRPTPQARALLHGAQRRGGADSLQGPRRRDPQPVTRRGGEPETAQQDRLQTRHRLVAS